MKSIYSQLVKVYLTQSKLVCIDPWRTRNSTFRHSVSRTYISFQFSVFKIKNYNLNFLEIISLIRYQKFVRNKKKKHFEKGAMTTTNGLFLSQIWIIFSIMYNDIMISVVHCIISGNRIQTLKVFSERISPYKGSCTLYEADLYRKDQQ